MSWQCLILTIWWQPLRPLSQAKSFSNREAQASSDDIMYLKQSQGFTYSIPLHSWFTLQWFGLPCLYFLHFWSTMSCRSPNHTLKIVQHFRAYLEIKLASTAFSHFDSQTVVSQIPFQKLARMHKELSTSQTATQQCLPNLSTRSQCRCLRANRSTTVSPARMDTPIYRLRNYGSPDITYILLLRKEILLKRFSNHTHQQSCLLYTSPSPRD